MSKNPALQVYADNAAKLAAQWQSYTPAEVYAPVVDLLPAAPARIADIGAGPGREAAWLAGQGHQVVAVEPVQEFRDMAPRPVAGIKLEWLDDSLPALARLRHLPGFDVALLSGVWHHVAPDVRDQAMRAMADVLLPGGVLILSLRHGRVDHDRGLYAADVAEALALAADAGLTQKARRETGSVQQHNRKAGVEWTWLALRKDPAEMSPGKD